ncbi:UTRA domain-containing protein, partial [Streptomyces sp. NPDC018967]|uniref:UTRA domain-containing protein n=1 Tax=Streptomyces sp. NPDC018967 TaxID=3365059 RepID=UPI0037B1E12C
SAATSSGETVTPPINGYEPWSTGRTLPDAALVKSYYPLAIAQGTAITDHRKIRGGTPALLAELGFPPRLSVDRVSARIPTQEQHQALSLPSDLPVLRTLRVVYSDDDRPIEATVMVKAGHLHELQYEFTPG